MHLQMHLCVGNAWTYACECRKPAQHVALRQPFLPSSYGYEWIITPAKISAFRLTENVILFLAYVKEKRCDKRVDPVKSKLICTCLLRSLWLLFAYTNSRSILHIYIYCVLSYCRCKEPIYMCAAYIFYIHLASITIDSLILWPV